MNIVYSILVGLLAWLVLNLFLPAQTALVLAVVIGILTFFGVDRRP